MEMRIVLPEAASPDVLAERLMAAFGRDRIALLDDRREIDITVEGDSDRAVLGVLDTVERWLDDVPAGSAEMWLGENSYRISRSVPAESWQ